jgi:drug/metabolite transporter (DMT)-like permease
MGILPITGDPDAGPPERRRARMTKVVVAILFATVLVAVGEVLLSAGMKQVGKDGHQGFRMVLAAATSPLVVGGVLLSAAFFGIYLLTLSWADISFVMPFTALSYLFVAIMASHFLQEQVTPARWAGTLLIVFGVIIISLSERS